MAAGDAIDVFGTQKTLEANGASIASGSVVQADDASYSKSADGSNYRWAKFVLAATFATAPTEGKTIALYARPLNIDGTNDSEVPEATRPTKFIGIFVVNNVTTTQYMEIDAKDVPREADYYLYNDGTGQTVSSGWTLKVTPWTVRPSLA